MDEWLKFIHNDIKDTLKFAETKNAALLTFLSATLWGFGNLYLSNSFFKSGKYHLAGQFQIGLIIICIISVILSFFPRFKMMGKNGNQSRGTNVDFNLFYFREIAKKEAIAVFNYLKDDTQTDFKHRDLATQIRSLSYVAKIKYRFFNITVVTFLMATIAIWVVALLTGNS